MAGNGGFSRGIAALALERVEQARLLAADVGARSAVQDEAERVIGAEDRRAEVARLRRLGDRRLEDVGLMRVLAADVDEGAADLRAVGRDDDALDQHVRVLLHQLAVLERAGLGLVGIADQVLVDVAVGQERRLLAHLEAGAAAAADARVHDRGQHVLAGHASALRRLLVAPAPLIDLERVQPGLVDAFEQDLHASRLVLVLVGRGLDRGRGPGPVRLAVRRKSGRVGPRRLIGGRRAEVGLAGRHVWIGAAAVAQLLVLEHRASRLEVGDDLIGVLVGQRARHTRHPPRPSGRCRRRRGIRTSARSTSSWPAAAASIASKNSSAPRSEQEMFVHTYTSWRRFRRTSRTCRRRWPPRSGRPESAASQRRPARSPRASTSREHPGRRAGRGLRPSGGRDTWPSRRRSCP